MRPNALMFAGVVVLWGPVTLAGESAVWEKRSPANKPSARSDSAMAYDATRGRTVLFGGYAFTPSAETWEWDGETWTKRTDAGPPARFGHAMAYDSVRARIVMFGGEADVYPETFLADTWEWDGVAWVEMPGSGPSARCNHGLAFDGKRTILFSGNGSGSGASAMNTDTWGWDGVSWTELATDGAPPILGPMLYCSVPACTVVGGGLSDTVLFDWNGSSWKIAPTTGAPAARSYSAVAYNTARRAAVLFGGSPIGAGYFGDTWEYRSSGWTMTTSSGPPARQGLALAYDAKRSRVVLFGGKADAEFADTWEYHTRGGPCLSDAECDTGLCSDGVCCEHVCATCETCADPVQTGLCTPVHGADDDTCNETRTCDPAGLCRLRDGQPCSSADGCASGTCTEGVCCASTCKSRCDSKGRCLADSTCSDDHTSVMGSESMNCSPYRCVAGEGCDSSCTSVDDCAVGFDCDGAHCTTQSASPISDSGGCSMSAPQHAGVAAWFVIAFGLCLRARRSRAVQNS